MKSLIELANMLLSGERIAGDVVRGSRKWLFKHIGMKAMGELAALLGLKSFEISFNPGGPGVGGDLTLMGIAHNGRGVYVSVDGDGSISPSMGFMFRSISHLKDYSGGRNNWLPLDALKDSEMLKDAIGILLKDEDLVAAA